MEIEGKTLVWLTAGEVEIAVRNYAREAMNERAGHAISATARVSGLDKLNEARHSVSVMVLHSNVEVK